MTDTTRAMGAAGHPVDARELERLPLDLPATFALAGEPAHTARVMNLSIGGLFLGAPVVAVPGTRLTVSVALPLGDGVCTLDVAVEVRWTNGRSGFSAKVPPGMGVQFLDLQPDALACLARFMSEQWAARRAGTALARAAGEGRLARRHFLADFPARVTRQDGSVTSARVVNLSAFGVFLATPAPEAVGREVPLTLTLPYRGRTESVRVIARVRWTNDSARPRTARLPAGMGLEFRRCPPATRRVLQEVVDDLRMQAEGAWGL